MESFVSASRISLESFGCRSGRSVEDNVARGAVEDQVAWDVVMLCFERTQHELESG